MLRTCPMTNGETVELNREINIFRTTIARDLGGMLRDLESIKLALGDKMTQHSDVASFPTPQSYVVEYRDAAGQSRIAVARTVIRLSDGRMTLFTTRDDCLALLTTQIESWEPVLKRENEPFPDGWWRQP